MTNEIYKSTMMRLGVLAGRTFTKTELQVFYDFLKHLDDKEFSCAAEKVMQTEKFYPTTNYVELILSAAKSSNSTSPEAAWEQLIEASLSWEKERDLDKNILRAFKSLGFEWHSIRPGCGFIATPEKLGYMRREFMQFFKEYSEKDESKQKLIGGSDANKRVGGWQGIGGK